MSDASSPLSRFLGLLLGLTLLSFAASASAAGPAPDDSEAGDASTASTRDPSDLPPKELTARIRAMDPDDGAVRFARAMQRDGLLFLVGGGALAGLSLGVAAAETLGDRAQFGPFLVAVGVPLGMGVMVVGIPQVVLSNRLLSWYSLNGPAPSSMARLKLLRRWRLESLQWMRDGSLFGAAFMGVAGVFSGVVWAVRDVSGSNGTPGDPASYRPLDALTSVAFLGAAAGLGLSGLYWLGELQAEKDTPHRLFAMPSLSVGPTFATTSGLPSSRPTGLVVNAGLTLSF